MNKFGRDIQSLRCSGSESLFIHSEGLMPNFVEDIRSFNPEIIKVYVTLSNYSSSLPSSGLCMRYDELVDVLGSVSQNLLDLIHLYSWHVFVNAGDDFPAQIEALEDKLSFLKSFTRFAKLFCAKRRTLEDLLTHIQFEALNAARLSYEFFFCEKVEQLRYFKKGELLKKSDINVNLQVYEIYIEVLREASKSSASLQTTTMDHHKLIVLQEFIDSLVTSLWELLMCDTSSFMVSVKSQVQILFEGLRFLRSILREPQMDELHGKIVTVFCEAGIVICFLGVKKVDCSAMLVNIDSGIKLIKAQINDSGMIEKSSFLSDLRRTGSSQDFQR
ncbi:hypothetical protein ACH5RR_028445 [Cinchona calisaya]|uniref:Late blight resistance protein R1A-like N-terminal domain-containing protein n=1 Tax=Cinchona calisaya TaxID=153742 RepID=A0ABD2YQR0_9GENT